MNDKQEHMEKAFALGDEISRQIRNQAIKDCIAAVEEQPIIRSSNGAWTIESVQKPIVIAALTKLLEENY